MCYARRQRSSWARIKLSKSLYQNTVPRDLISLLSSLALSFFYFCWVVFSSVRIFRDPFQAVRFVLLSCCSIFNDQFASLSRDLVIIPHRPAFVNPFFQLFLKSFSGSSALPSVLFPCPPCGEPPYYTTYHVLLSRTFFTFFPFFYLFGTSNSFYTSFCTTFWAFSMQFSQFVWRR